MNSRLLTFCLLIFSVSLTNCNKGGEGSTGLYESEASDSGVDTAAVRLEKDTAAVAPVTEMTFAETEHDFGTINDGVMASHTFTFTNTGKAPLVISDARADCGCTVPSWTKDPVLPGEEGKIDVKYNSSGRGGQTVSKTVTVIANTEPSDNKLTIKAVVRSKGGSPLKK